MRARARTLGGFLAVCALISGGCLPVLATAARAETTNQSCSTTSNLNAYLNGQGQARAQTFTAQDTTVAGFDIDYATDNIMTKAQTLAGELHDGSPSGALLGSVRLHRAAGLVQPTWLRFTMPSPVAVVPGQTYALVVYRLGSFIANQGPSWMTCSDAYAGGQGLYRLGTTFTDLGHDFAFRVISASPPGVSVGDASSLEGDAGSRALNVPVTLTEPSSSPLTVSYTLAGGTATGGTSPDPGVDFNDLGGASGSVTLAAGAMIAYVPISVYGDSSAEPDETVALTLTSVTGGAYSIARASGTGTILNDDGFGTGPALGVGDLTVVSPRVGKLVVQIPAVLSHTATANMPDGYFISDGTAHWTKSALTGGDYGGRTSVNFTFWKNTTTHAIAVPIWAYGNASSLERVFTVTIGTPNDPTVTAAHPVATIRLLPAIMAPNLPRAPGRLPARNFEPDIVNLDIGGPCTALDALNGSVPGTEISVAWLQPSGGEPVTSYVASWRIGYPVVGQAATVLQQTLPNTATESAPECVPVGREVLFDVASANDAGTSIAVGVGRVFVPRSDLAWTPPPSLADGVPAAFTATDPCPTTRPDGKPLLGARVLVVTVRAAGQTQQRLFIGSTLEFDFGGAQDLAATIVADCILLSSLDGSPTLTGQYALTPIQINP
jgi:hypothetical protein